MSRLFEDILSQHKKETKNFITLLKTIAKEKQSENQAKITAKKTSDKELDFSHHLAAIEMFEENLPASLKFEDFREFKKIIRDSTKGENWYRLLSVILEHDQAFLAQHYLVQKMASNYRNRVKKLTIELQNTKKN